MNLRMTKNTVLSKFLIEQLVQEIYFNSSSERDKILGEQLFETARIYTDEFKNGRKVGEFLEYLQLTGSENELYSSFNNVLIAEHRDIKTTETLSKLGYFMDGCEDMPFISREKELEFLNISLERKIKNNVIIVGEPGVGKTALVRAYKRLNIGQEIFVIEFNRALTNTKYRGEFESRITDLLDYAKNNNVILFIDEIHILLNVGKVEGGLSGGDILKTYITDPDIRIIGATTPIEFKKIESDRALQRRFSVIKLEEFGNDQIKDIYMTLLSELEIKGLDMNDFGRIKCFLDCQKDRYYPDKLVDFLDLFSSVERHRGDCKVQDVFDLGGYDERG